VSSVNSVRGPVAPEALGTTLMHEHVFVFDPAVAAAYGAGWWDEEERVDDAVAKLERARSNGIDTLVDVTVLGIGRDIGLLKRVGERVDLNVVVSTGLYTYGELPRLFRNEGPGLAIERDEPMVEMFLRDIREGIEGTKVKAGMLKGVWETPKLGPDAERVHRAIAATQRASGVPVTVHTNSAAQTGRQLLDFYRREGVDPARMIVAHAGDSSDLDYLRDLMDTGATAGFDRFGLDTFGATPERVETVAALCQLGYADRIVLSQDAAAFTESWPHPAARAELQRQLPDWHHSFVAETVLDLLRARGVAEEQLDSMMRRNPARLLHPSL
jgi:phosphotriesterase-related protein